MDRNDTDVARHYSRADLLDAIRGGLRAAGKDLACLTPADLAPVDHFHVGGVDETVALTKLAGFTRPMHVVDAGGGLGGPARMLASEVGCRVTVVDLTPDYCAAGAEMTRWVGLEERVDFRCANALDLPFDDASLDGAWTQHATMNIADKEALYRELHRVLRPGARLAMHEITAGGRSPVTFPVPWASEPSQSHLRRPDALRAAITAAGFREVAWQDRTAWSIEWIRERLAAAKAAGAPPPLGPHLIHAEFPARLANVFRSFEEGRVEVVQAVFTR